WLIWIILSAATVSAALFAQSQQPAAAEKASAKVVNTGTTPKPILWPSPALADGPIPLETGIERNLRMVITKGFVQPWSMAFLPDGGILVTERPGRLRLIRNGALQAEPIAGLPPIYAKGIGGLMDIALHPHFAENSLIYFTYQKPPAADDSRPNAPGTLMLGRGRWTGTAITGFENLFSAVQANVPSRILFGRDGMIYMSVAVGDPPEAARAQDPNDLSGKVLRLRDDGKVPPDNPFAGRAGYRPEIYTLGHRMPLGLAINPATGDIWECENGPNGGDEVNILAPGKNYGWPEVSYGRFYGGPRVSTNPYREGMEPPVIFWVPAIAVSGLTFYTGDRFPNWKNNLFIGGMRQGEVPRSGHLERVDFNGEWEELHREGMLRDLQQRIRDVRQGPDGLLYLLTAENAGALIRIEPAK
ncbi:MAG: PQQ-dependent sugar dehydrogenase, partial [Bryobacterales bacterium]|nr:PQQ-dependent sugar dehydrogenase [Bryobacterales bacterium]